MIYMHSISMYFIYMYAPPNLYAHTYIYKDIYVIYMYVHAFGLRTPDPYFLAQGHPMLTPDRSGCVQSRPRPSRAS